MSSKFWQSVQQWANKRFGIAKLHPTESPVTEARPIDPEVITVTSFPVVRNVDISKANMEEAAKREAAVMAEKTSEKTVAKVPGVEKLTPSQLNALHDTAAEIGIPTDWLATVISFETAGTFSPKIDNRAGSGAFGLIQFMPKTAKAILGTSTEASAVLLGKSMTFEEQLQRMVIPYFSWHKGKLKSLSDVYLAIFYPVAMNKPDDYVVGRDGSAVYRQNKGFDKSGKGYITRADITSKINNLLNNALGIVTITGGSSSSGGFTAIVITMLLTGLGYAGWIDWNRPNSRIRSSKARAESFMRRQAARLS